VHTSLLEAQIAMLDFQATRWLIDGEVPPQAGNHHPTGTPMGVYPSADGHINLAAPGNRMWRVLCKAIGADDLLENPAYADPEKRSRNRDDLNRELGDYTRQRPSAEWIDLLNPLGIPCGPIYSIDQTMRDPQVRHLGIATPVDHPKLGRLELVGQPVHLTRTPQHMRSAAPERGEHTDEVLAEIGYGPDTVADLRERRVIR
jgi:formyl-CoA transferase